VLCSHHPATDAPAPCGNPACERQNRGPVRSQDRNAAQDRTDPQRQHLRPEPRADGALRGFWDREKTVRFPGWFGHARMGRVVRLEESHRNRLLVGAHAVGVCLTHEQVERLEEYARLLREWGQRLNLTRILSAEAIIDRHFVDSLAVCQVVPPQCTLLDVGTGAGFPGAVVAVARPDVRVTLCESVAKKTAFLRVLVHRLHLRATVLQCRSDSLLREGRVFQAVVSRAVLPLEQWVAHASSLVAPGGSLLAMASDAPSGLVAPAGWEPPRLVSYRLPDGTPRTLLVWQRPREHSPEGGPRPGAPPHEEPVASG